ncbi:low affinity iron permease family protein [Streptomyces tirandamycinicus]|uniref:low affinity iron permease family protein n=1 Tax=Streptomyces tirandamycinicus TaxID=2174846 RepID=UPI000376D2D6
MTTEHPADRGGPTPGTFERLAEKVSNFTSSPVFFGFCLLLVFTVVGVHFADVSLKWKIFAGECMTAVTLMLLALLKNSELRGERAIQRKLDAIAAAILEAHRDQGGKAHEDLKAAIRLEEET